VIGVGIVAILVAIVGFTVVSRALSRLEDEELRDL
jgi:hypothetical protein